MSVVQKSEGRLEPASQNLRSEVAIIAGIAKATVGNTPTVDWSELGADYDKIRDLIERTIPDFDRFNERVREPGGFYLPNGAKERVWETTTGKANFSVAALTVFQTKGSDRLVLQTSRSHDQFNTTVYGLDDRYRGISNERRVIFLNPDDMKARGISPMRPVDITSFWNHEGQEETRRARHFLAVPYDVPAGSAMAYFPEANALVPIHSTAAVSNTPASKAVEIEVELSP
ncbi:MAG: molybdopterin dinucleotide binding domain-containing protein [Verrucomicrobiota bacterium]